MSKPAMGAVVHTKLLNHNQDAYDSATHQLEDFPQAGFWKPEKGIFIVPERQVTELKRKAKDGRL